MKLWLLRPVGYPGGEDWGGTINNTPWDPWYDKAFGFVVRAHSEDIARVLADLQQGAESYNDEESHPWLNPELSTCVVLTIDGPEEVVIRDFASA